MIAARVPADLAHAFSEIAQRQDRSFSQELRHLMRRHVALNETPSGEREARDAP